MRPEDLILVSVDDHIVEPPDLFDGRLPQKYVEAAPKLVRRDDGTMAWRYQGLELPNVALNAVAGRPPEEYGMEPTTFEEIRAGTWNVHERVRDMSANGVLGSLNFPSFPRFTGQVFAENLGSDPGEALAMLRAYNDWHIDGWCGEYPDRFIPLSLPPMWDPQLMADEVHRVADKGCHAVTFSSNPYDLGYPSLHSDHWDPFWAACDELGTVVCIHLGSNSTFNLTAPDASINVHISAAPISLFSCALDLIWSPVFTKFKNLTIALSEGGIGWIPYYLERIDYVYAHHKAWTGADFGGKLPSEVFKEHVLTCFIDDAFGVANLEYLNRDLVAWECDYPHSDSTWPLSPETVAPNLDGLSEEDIARVTHGNAMRVFSFDPFSIRPAERCTAGALRTEAVGHDVSIVSKGLKVHETTLRMFGEGEDFAMSDVVGKANVSRA
jgi:predicted TIM-barrel fold metal-dependent hydrolase